MENETADTAPEKPTKLGRPTLYTPELGDLICEKISEGKSMRTICLSDEFPEARTIYRWLRTHTEFCQQYARAKCESADAMGEDMIDISDDGSNDWMEVRKKNGEVYVVLDKEAVARSRLRVDTRKWLMEKLKPKKYGANPIQVQALDKNGDPTDQAGTTVLIAQESLIAALENVKNGKERGEKVERELENQRTGPL